MKKDYFSPKLDLYSFNIDDAVMASTGALTDELGGGDWGVRDEF